jgi:SHS2 domain-containing protein
MKKYEFRSDIAISDSAFYAYGKDYAELIKNACLAVIETMVDIEKIEEKIEKQITVKADSMEKLLYNVMEEVVYLKDAKQLVFHSFEVKDLKDKPPNCKVVVIMKGEKIDRKKHEAHADVKAVTYLDYGIQKTKEGYRASVTLDI